MLYQSIILIILLCICLTTFLSLKEGYISSSFGSLYCSNCSHRNRKKCAACNNCGYCINSNGNGECIVGDINGPYFRQDCKIWEKGNPILTPLYIEQKNSYWSPSFWRWRGKYEQHNKKYMSPGHHKK